MARSSACFWCEASSKQTRKTERALPDSGFDRVETSWRSLASLARNSRHCVTFRSHFEVLMPEIPNSSAAATPCDWRHDLLPGSCSHFVQVGCGISAWHFSLSRGWNPMGWRDLQQKPMENIPFSMIKTYQNLGFFPVFDYFLQANRSEESKKKNASPGMREDRNQPCPLETWELWIPVGRQSWCSHGTLGRRPRVAIEMASKPQKRPGEPEQGGPDSPIHLVADASPDHFWPGKTLESNGKNQGTLGSGFGFFSKTEKTTRPLQMFESDMMNPSWSTFICQQFTPHDIFVPILGWSKCHWTTHFPIFPWKNHSFSASWGGVALIPRSLWRAIAIAAIALTAGGCLQLRCTNGIRAGSVLRLACWSSSVASS